MNNFTLGTTYYDNPDYLNVFITTHIEYVDELIIIDDGSQIYPIETILDKYKHYHNLKVYKVLHDYGFNSHGCRNLIVNLAKYDWILLMDSDRIMSYPDVMTSCIRKTKLKANIRYKFIAHFRDLGLNTHASVNDYLIHRDHFKSVGGYDEEIRGVRDGDRSFFKQLISAGGKERILYDCDIQLTRGPSLLRNHKCLSKYDREMTLSEKVLISQREQKPDPQKPTLTFEWTRLK